MAVSKLASTPVVLADVDSHGFSMLRDSLHYFKAALCQFRVCHDLCATSKLLDEGSVVKLDQCAAEFRHLSTTVATLAEKVGSVWCRTCLLFYRNIEKVKGNPAKILGTISAQSKELADGFKSVADMSAKLSAKFQTVEARDKTAQSEITKQFRGAVKQLKELEEKVQKSIMPEAQESNEPTTDVKDWEETFHVVDPKNYLVSGDPSPRESVTQPVLEDFDKRQHEASEKKKKAEEDYKRAQMQSRSVAANAQNVKRLAKVMLRFLPLEILFPNTDAQAAGVDIELEDAQAHEKIAETKFQEAKREFEFRKDQAEKAKVLASQLTCLMVALGQVELICGLIQKYWSSQAEYYGDLSKGATSPEELQDKLDFTNEVAQRKVKWLSEEKELLEKYHHALTVINNSYNFSA